MPISTSLANSQLDAMLAAGAWLAISTADPGADGSGLAEPVGGSYARVDIHTLFAAAAGRSKTNNADIVFPTATGAWGTIGWWAIMDASVAGNLKWRAAFTGGPVNITDVVKFTSGQLSVAYS